MPAEAHEEFLDVPGKPPHRVLETMAFLRRRPGYTLPG